MICGKLPYLGQNLIEIKKNILNVFLLKIPKYNIFKKNPIPFDKNLSADALSLISNLLEISVIYNFFWFLIFTCSNKRKVKGLDAQNMVLMKLKITSFFKISIGNY